MFQIKSNTAYGKTKEASLSFADKNVNRMLHAKANGKIVKRSKKKTTNMGIVQVLVYADFEFTVQMYPMLS
jgi:hypothetical protein